MSASVHRPAGRGENVLVVIPPTVVGTPASGDTVVLGVPLRRRVALSAQRAGFDRVGEALEVEALPGRTRVVLLPANVVPQTRWLRELLAMPLPVDTLVFPGHGASTDIGTERPHLQEWIDRGW